MQSKTEQIKAAKRWIEKLRDQIGKFNSLIAKAEEWDVRRALVQNRMRAESNLLDWRAELKKIQTK